MKVILLKDVAKLGRRYDVKDVNSGHALNLLIPQGLAIGATSEALKRYEAIRVKAEGERKIHEDLAAKNLSDLDGKVLRLSGKANDKGHLFAGIHREEIAAALKKQMRLDLAPESIKLEHPLKEVGEHTVEADGAGKSARFKVLIEAA